MSHDSSDVLLRAFLALAQGDFERLLALLDPQSLARIREARIAFARQMWRHATLPRTQKDGEALLREWGVASIEELESLTAEAIALRGLERLPALRSTLQCVVEGHSTAENDQISVTFRMAWSGHQIQDGPVREAKLVRTASGWRLKPLLLSPWLVPGFENTLVAESDTR